MLKRIVSPENSVFSLQLRQDLFTLAQMRRDHIMQFFDLRREKNEWDGIDLNNEKPLFFIVVAAKRFKGLLLEKIGVDRVIPSHAPVPMIMLNAVVGNTGIHSANLIELNPDFSDIDAKVIKANLTIDRDVDLIYKHEFTGMLGDPEKLRRRLLRYFDTGVNWDESKEFLFKGIEPPNARQSLRA